MLTQNLAIQSVTSALEIEIAFILRAKAIRRDVAKVSVVSVDQFINSSFGSGAVVTNRNEIVENANSEEQGDEPTGQTVCFGERRAAHHPFSPAAIRFSSFRITFPVTVIGSASRNSTSRG